MYSKAPGSTWATLPGAFQNMGISFPSASGVNVLERLAANPGYSTLMYTSDMELNKIYMKDALDMSGNEILNINWKSLPSSTIEFTVALQTVNLYASSAGVSWKTPTLAQRTISSTKPVADVICGSGVGYTMWSNASSVNSGYGNTSTGGMGGMYHQPYVSPRDGILTGFQLYTFFDGLNLYLNTDKSVGSAFQQSPAAPPWQDHQVPQRRHQADSRASYPSHSGQPCPGVETARATH